MIFRALFECSSQVLRFWCTSELASENEINEISLCSSCRRAPIFTLRFFPLFFCLLSFRQLNPRIISQNEERLLEIHSAYGLSLLSGWRSTWIFSSNVSINDTNVSNNTTPLLYYSHQSFGINIKFAKKLTVALGSKLHRQPRKQKQTGSWPIRRFKGSESLRVCDSRSIELIASYALIGIDLWLESHLLCMQSLQANHSRYLYA